MRGSTIIYVLFVAAAVCFYHPAASTDLNQLIPVETLWVERQEEQVIVAGKDVEGSGDSWNSAMEDLQDGAEGTVFLETVDRVVISVEAEECLHEIRKDTRLRPSVQLYLLHGKAAANLDPFTAAHESAAVVENEEQLPMIVEKEGRYRIAGTQ